jgi:hypothetical protein
MYLSSGCIHVSMLAIVMVQPFERVIIDHWVNVARFQVVNVEFDGMSEAIYSAIGNAWIILIKFEPNPLELLVPH